MTDILLGLILLVLLAFWVEFSSVMAGVRWRVRRLKIPRRLGKAIKNWKHRRATR